MNPITRTVAAAAALLAVTAVAPAAFAEASGRTALGNAYVSGGIGAGELAALDARRDKYSLWVITAARVSGAYLADVRVRITDANQAVVLEHVMAGPWLLVDLPLGRFDVEASYRGQTMNRQTTIHAGDRHQMIFYFDVAADVLPKEPAKM